MSIANNTQCIISHFDKYVDGFDYTHRPTLSLSNGWT